MCDISRSLFSTNLEFNGFFYHDGDPEVFVWDNFAKKDHVHSAIATSLRNEKNKSMSQIKFLENEMIDDPNSIILDLGCGYGRIYKYLKVKFQTYIGIDFSEVMLRIFHEEYAKENTILIKSRIDEIPINRNSVDYVFTIATFIHNPKDVVQRSIEQCYNILKDGGKLFLKDSLLNKNSISGLQGSLYLLFSRIRGNKDSNVILRYYYKRELANLFALFNSVEIIPTGKGLLLKSILVLPNRYNQYWKKFAIAVNNRFRSFPLYFDIIATK